MTKDDQLPLFADSRPKTRAEYAAAINAAWRKAVAAQAEARRLQKGASRTEAGHRQQPAASKPLGRP